MRRSLLSVAEGGVGCMSNVVTCNINIEYHRPLTPFQMLILYLRCMNHKLSLSVTRLSSLVCRLDMYSLSLENI